LAGGGNLFSPLFGLAWESWCGGGDLVESGLVIPAGPASFRPEMRKWSTWVSAAFAAVFSSPGAGRAEEGFERALDLHRRMLTLDSHIDTPAVLQRPGFDITRRNSWEEDLSQVDFPRLREGGMDGGFLVVYVPQTERTPAARAESVALARSRFQVIEQLVARHGGQAGVATDAAGLRRLREEGRFAFAIGIENAQAIGNDLDVLREFHARGARYLGITHMKNNDFADSSTDPAGPEHMGLSHLGRAAIQLCNELGILPDVSHASDDAAREILRISRGPVIASHSGCHAVFPHPRNLNDELLRGIAASGGVVQVNFFSAYVADLPPDPARTAALDEWRARYRDRWNELDEATKRESARVRLELEKRFPLPLAPLERGVDHIDHAVRLLGIDHVGISLDFDGGGGVMGVMDMAGMPRITAELMRRGYSEEDLAKLWGGNLLRALEVARLLAEAPPAEVVPGGPVVPGGSRAKPSRQVRPK
jgi:membrane dipeptidase